MKSYPETHQKGVLSMMNEEFVKEQLDKPGVDVGVQIARDGRIWLCINGTAFIRFKPDPPDVQLS